MAKPLPISARGADRFRRARARAPWDSGGESGGGRVAARPEYEDELLWKLPLQKHRPSPQRDAAVMAGWRGKVKAAATALTMCIADRVVNPLRQVRGI